MRKCIEILVKGLRLRGVIHLAKSNAHSTYDGLGVIMLHPGFLPRSAQSDSAVALADALAANGVETARIDLPGLGDSEGDLPEDSFTFIDNVQVGGLADVAAECVDLIKAELGWKKVIIGGHCGAAITSFFATASREKNWLAGLFGLDVIFHNIKSAQAQVKDQMGNVVQEAPGLRREVLRNELRLAILNTSLGGTMQKLAQRARETLKRHKNDSPGQTESETDAQPDETANIAELPAEANVQLLDAIEHVVNAELPVLFVTADDPTKNVHYDYLAYLRAKSDKPFTHSRIAGTDHGFVAGDGKARLGECLNNWIAREFRDAQPSRVALPAN